jgi:hypothetical protein
MDSPAAIVKQSLNPGSIIKLLVGSLVVFAILDFANLTGYILYPVTSLKAKFATKTT